LSLPSAAVLNLVNLMIPTEGDQRHNVLVVKSGQESMNMAVHTADTYLLVNELNGAVSVWNYPEN
jgi:hypothetical protein